MSTNVNVESVLKSLEGIKSIKVSVNVRSIWVKTTSKKAEKALKELGFTYAASRDAWWLTYAPDAPVQVKATAKKAQPKAEAKSTQAPAKAQAQTQTQTGAPAKKFFRKSSQPKAERVELPEAVKAAVIADVTRKYPGVQASVEGTWLWVAGEKTREYKDGLKKHGFYWSAKRQAWHVELPQAYIAAVTASVQPATEPEQPKAVVVEAEALPEKAEPKAQKARTRARKVNAPVHQPAMAGLFA